MPRPERGMELGTRPRRRSGEGAGEGAGEVAERVREMEGERVRERDRTREQEDGVMSDALVRLLRSWRRRKRRWLK